MKDKANWPKIQVTWAKKQVIKVQATPIKWMGLLVIIVNLLFWLLVWLIYYFVTKAQIFDSLLVASICGGVFAIAWLVWQKTDGLKFRYYTYKLCSPVFSFLAPMKSPKPNLNYDQYVSKVKHHYDNYKYWYWINLAVQAGLFFVFLITFLVSYYL